MSSTKVAQADIVADDSQDVPLKTMVGWGIGSLAIATLYNTTNMLLLRYLVDYVGIAAALASTLIAFSKVYDTVTDPLMGVITDRTKSSLGRRRPWLFVGSFLCAIALPLLFITPQGMSDPVLITWVVFGLLFYASAYTVFSVPYMAMPAEMTDDPHQRSVIFSWRVKAIAVGQVVAGGGAPALIVYFGAGQQGHAGMSLVLGAIILVSALLSFRYTRDARALPMVTSEKPQFREQLRSLLADKNLVWLLNAKMVHLVAVAFGASSFAFFTLRVLGLPDTYLSLIIVSSTVGILASAPPLTKLSRHIGKQNTYSMSVAIYAVVHIWWYFATPDDGVFLMGLRGLIMGVGGSGMMLMAQSLLSDVMADDRTRTGNSREGVYAGLYTTIEKFSYAVGIAIVGVLLGSAGYIEGNAAGIDQPQSALDVIRLSVSFIPAGLAILAAIAMHRVRPSTAVTPRM
jgi:GPH family glycoside/pentoside/hexuronide:cation symporter